MRPKTVRVWRAIAAAAVVAACVDGPTTPGRFGELRIRPTYATGDEPGDLGLALDSAAVRITRRGEPDAPLVDTRIVYASDTVSFGWILDLRAAAETLLVDVTLWGGATRYYDGADTVEVRDTTAAASAEPVPVDYVGPAIVATVTVTPQTDSLDALGATTTLAAVARDRHDVIVPGATFSWTSGAGVVASVDPSGVVTAAGNGTTSITATTGSVGGSATVVVRQRVAEIAVTPSAITLTALGATQTLGAQPRDANGHAVADAAVAWSSDAPAVASVDPATGLVTAVAGGTATITATSDGVSATSVVTVNPIADVASIVVSPSDTTLIALGATLQYSAEAHDAGGTVLTGVQFTWASSATAVATVDPSGLASAAGHGAAQITASAGAVTGRASLTVDLSTTIASVTVTPGAATLSAVGATQPFTALARDAGNNVVPVTQFAWSSSRPTVAGVDPATGLATAATHGVTTIAASVAGITGTAELTVDLTPGVATVTVTPAAATLLAVGATEQFTAVALDAGGLVVPGVPFVWTSGTAAVATVDPTGLATAAGHGTTAITASTGSVSGSATLTVNLTPTIATITVTPAAATLTTVGATEQFTAVALDAGGFVVPGVPFSWTSGTTAVATIDAVSGLARAVAHGTTTISATAGGVSGTASLTVNLATVITSVTVTPAAATLTAVGGTQPFTALAHDAGNNVVPVAQFDWSSSVPDVASVDPATGLATAASHGATTIAASVAGVSGTAALTVDLTPVIASVTVAPPTATLTAVGTTQPYTATARDASGAEVPVAQFAWTSSVPAVATIDPVTGLATAAGHGITTITASVGGVAGTAELAVNLAAIIESVTVTPAETLLTAVGATQQFTAVARDAGNNVVPVAQFAWTSSVPAVATVEPVTGLATAAGHGTASITATVGTVSGTAALTVDLSGTIATIAVTPSSVTLDALGATQAFTAEARDGAGNVVAGITFEWSSTSAATATIDPVTGVATAVANGTTHIAATAGGVTGQASLIVEQRIVTVVVTPDTVILVGSFAPQQFAAQAFDANGFLVPNVTFEWTTNDPVVAIVDATGLVTPLVYGYALIKAEAGGVRGSAWLFVEP